MYIAQMIHVREPLWNITVEKLTDAEQKSKDKLAFLKKFMIIENVSFSLMMTFVERGNLLKC